MQQGFSDISPVELAAVASACFRPAPRRCSPCPTEEFNNDAHHHCSRFGCRLRQGARYPGFTGSPGGDLVFVSGFPPFGENGEVVSASIERQTEIVLDHMRTTLEAAGSCLTKVAKCNVYVDDVAHAETVNRVYNRYIPVDPPARILRASPHRQAHSTWRSTAWPLSDAPTIDCDQAPDRLNHAERPGALQEAVGRAQDTGSGESEDPPW